MARPDNRDLGQSAEGIPTTENHSEAASPLAMGPSPPQVVTPATPTPRPVPLVPDHDLVRTVGRGAYGEVWLARSVLGTPRAVKVVHRDDFSDEHPFEREFRGIQKYEPVSRSHDGLIDILQVGRNDEDRYFYYVMELADPAAPPPAGEPDLDNEHEPSGNVASQPPVSAGSPAPAETRAAESDYTPRTLRLELRFRRRLPVDECLRLGISLAGAVAHLHAAGLVHRDIKPSNIIFVGGKPKLADIGLITDIGDAHSIVGTEGYLPPEGAGTPEADVYSLGKVLYEISTGLDRREFPALPAVIDDPRESGRLRELNEIILKACARDLSQRHRSATALRVELERLQCGRSIHRWREWESLVRGARKATPVAAVLALLALVSDQLANHRSAAPPSPVPERASVFVLPFRSADPESLEPPSQLHQRTTDAFIDALASLDGVRPSLRRSGWAARDDDELRHSLARTNDMRHILSGQLDERDGTLVLHLRLYERVSDRLVWEESFSGSTNHPAVIVLRAFDQLAGVLGLALRDDERRRIQELVHNNAKAAQLVAAGRGLLAKNVSFPTGHTQIIALAEEAWRLDPGYLDAAFLRASITREYAVFNRPPVELWPEIQREMLAILRVDDTHTGALTFMGGSLLIRDWDWAGFDEYSQRGLLWIRGPQQHFLRAFWLRIHGELPLALSELRHSEEPEPRDWVIRDHGAAARWVHRDYDEGIRYAQRTLELSPGVLGPHYHLARLHFAKGDYNACFESIDRFERINPMQQLTALRASAYARMGRTDRARALREQLIHDRSQPHVEGYFVAQAHAALGEPEEALDWLEKAERDRSEFLVMADFGGLRTDPTWDQLQSHPRFQALLKKVGLDRWPVPIHPLEE